MARFHMVTWLDTNFDFTATVLSFNSKTARAAYPVQSKQRCEVISYKRKQELIAEGRHQWLMLWDKSEPTKFNGSLIQ